MKLRVQILPDSQVTWHRKHCILVTNDSKSDLRNTKCEVMQCSIPWSLLFLVNVNDLPSSSKVLNPILQTISYAGYTSVFYEPKNIIKIFATVNEELINLININKWLMTDKLSLNVAKTKYLLFHKPALVDDLPLRLPKLSINN